ncbi:MAG: prepilin-type N-terminal cleavage/methylation domain-containing protein [Verrucomicrobiota bacterium]
MNINHKHGFTLVEVAAAVVLLAMALALALSGYMFSLKNINQGDVQNDLDIDVQLAMERLKKDLRLSSLDTMFYHPSGAGPYKAISFPMAEDSDGDGLMETDSDGNILWDETVIYHIRPTTPNQLVVTTFRPRDNSLTDAQRQAQLESVVHFGDGNSTYNGLNASSHVIFKNLLHWEIRPKEGRFDAYSPMLSRDSSSLGYILLDPGTHEFTFKVIDKNSNSGGYKIGIDQLFVSPSYSAREAEAQLPASAQSGAAAAIQYMPGDWKGNYQLVFPATGIGNSFSLSLDNDRWEETNFGALGYEAEDTEFIFDETLLPQDFVVKLRGNDIAWRAEEQTGSYYSSSDTNTALMFTNCSISVHVNGAQLATNGGWIAYNGQKCQLTFQANDNGTLQVDNVQIHESDKWEIVDLSGYANSSPLATFGGGASTASTTIPKGTTATTDPIDFEINATNNYIVTFDLPNDKNKCFPAIWVNSSTPQHECQITLSTGMVINTSSIIGLKSLFTSYPADGEYTSQIFDTHLPNPHFGDISWNAEIPAGTSLLMKVRSGDQPDLSDASDWDLVAASAVNPRSVGTSYKRYIQFQALLASDTNGDFTPKLKDVTIDWAGERQLVNIGGIFTKGPNYGMFEISVDGNPLRSALIVDLEIYKNVLVMNKESRRVTSSLQVELTPRNSGK